MTSGTRSSRVRQDVNEKGRNLCPNQCSTLPQTLTPRSHACGESLRMWERLLLLRLEAEAKKSRADALCAHPAF
jgi:hypothetical protein